MTTQQIRQAKRELRKALKEKRAAISADEKSRLDEAVCRNIINSTSFEYAGVILVFNPTEREIDIRAVFERARQLGKAVAFPRCVDKGVMEFYYAGGEDDFERSGYGILEPKETCRRYCEGDYPHPLCIVPSLCACADGSRLGYGGGFYDRFLSSFDGISMCVQYEMLMQEKIPFEKRYDKRCDIVVTERGVYVVGEK